MKITKSRLMEIVKEEIVKLDEEDVVSVPGVGTMRLDQVEAAFARWGIDPVKVPHIVDAVKMHPEAFAGLTNGVEIIRAVENGTLIAYWRALGFK